MPAPEVENEPAKPVETLQANTQSIVAGVTIVEYVLDYKNHNPDSPIKLASLGDGANHKSGISVRVDINKITDNPDAIKALQEKLLNETGKEFTLHESKSQGTVLKHDIGGEEILTGNDKAQKIVEAAKDLVKKAAPTLNQSMIDTRIDIPVLTPGSTNKTPDAATKIGSSKPSATAAAPASPTEPTFEVSTIAPTEYKAEGANRTLTFDTSKTFPSELTKIIDTIKSEGARATYNAKDNTITVTAQSSSATTNVAIIKDVVEALDKITQFGGTVGKDTLLAGITGEEAGKGMAGKPAPAPTTNPSGPVKPGASPKPAPDKSTPTTDPAPAPAEPTAEGTIKVLRDELNSKNVDIDLSQLSKRDRATILNVLKNAKYDFPQDTTELTTVVFSDTKKRSGGVQALEALTDIDQGLEKAFTQALSSGDKEKAERLGNLRNTVGSALEEAQKSADIANPYLSIVKGLVKEINTETDGMAAGAAGFKESGRTDAHENLLITINKALADPKVDKRAMNEIALAISPPENEKNKSNPGITDRGIMSDVREHWNKARDHNSKEYDMDGVTKFAPARKVTESSAVGVSQDGGKAQEAGKFGGLSAKQWMIVAACTVLSGGVVGGAMAYGAIKLYNNIKTGRENLGGVSPTAGVNTNDSGRTL